MHRYSFPLIETLGSNQDQAMSESVLYIASFIIIITTVLKHIIPYFWNGAKYLC